MRILGIDPGLNITGYGFIDYDYRSMSLVETGTIQPPKKDLLQNRIHKVFNHLQDLVAQFEPQVFVLEKLYAHTKHPTTASTLGHLRGVICLLCAQKNIQLAEHSVKRIRKALVGNGNATKEQTKQVVAHVLHIDAKALTLDASDALALALGFIHIQARKK